MPRVQPCDSRLVKRPGVVPFQLLQQRSLLLFLGDLAPEAAVRAAADQPRHEHRPCHAMAQCSHLGQNATQIPAVSWRLTLVFAELGEDGGGEVGLGAAHLLRAVAADRVPIHADQVERRRDVRPAIDAVVHIEDEGAREDGAQLGGEVLHHREGQPHRGAARDLVLPPRTHHLCVVGGGWGVKLLSRR